MDVYFFLKGDQLVGGGLCSSKSILQNLELCPVRYSWPIYALSPHATITVLPHVSENEAVLKVFIITELIENSTETLSNFTPQPTLRSYFPECPTIKFYG